MELTDKNTERLTKLGEAALELVGRCKLDAEYHKKRGRELAFVDEETAAAWQKFGEALQGIEDVEKAEAEADAGKLFHREWQRCDGYRSAVYFRDEKAEKLLLFAESCLEWLYTYGRTPLQFEDIAASWDKSPLPSMAAHCRRIGDMLRSRKG